MLDIDDIAAVVALAVKEATSPLLARLDALEQRELVLPEKGGPGEVDMDAVRAYLDSIIEQPKQGERGDDGRDGIGLCDALIDSEGNLVLTMTDGRTKTLGRVKGIDGVDGKDGEKGERGETFTLDDFDIVQYEDGRTFKFCFTSGEAMHSFEFAIPVPIYRGVFRDGQVYERGDMVTWGGAIWHCEKDTQAKPGADDWTLAVKKGRDGKDAK